MTGVKMEGKRPSGSSGDSNVNASRSSTDGGCSYTSDLVDEDDSLLDLRDDPEPNLSQNRLLFDLVSDTDTREAGDSLLKLGSSGGVTVSQTVSIVSAAVNRNQQCATGNRPNSQVNSVTGVLSPTSKTDVYSYGDPAVANRISSLHFIQSENAYPAGSYPNTERTILPTNDPFTMNMPSEFVTQESNSTSWGQTRPNTGGGSFYKDRYSDVAVSPSLADELPDVSLKQPLLQSHSQPRAEDDSDAHSSSITRDSPYSSSYTAGMVADYDVDQTHRPPATISHNVMLDSFPPPSRGGRGSGGEGEGGQRESVTHAEEIHCHSAVSQHTMNDKLAWRQLLTVLVLCVLFMIGETVGGVLSNSLALFTDVLHLASDLISYGISLLALYLSRKQATRRMTFGYHRAEVLGALFSVFVIWLVSGVLCYIAVERIVNKHYMDVKPDEMLITASLGVVFNLIMGFVLHSEKCCGVAKTHAKFGHGHSHSHNSSHSHGHCAGSNGYDYEPLDVSSSSRPEGRLGEVEEGEEEEEDSPQPHRHKNINVRAAFIHVVGDIIQSVGVLVAALIIKLKEDEKYRLADPICTFFFSLLVLCTTINVLRDTLRIIMEGAPQGVDFEQLKRELMSLDSVVTLHNLNVWALTMDRNALSVHLAIDNGDKNSQVLKAATKMLKRHNFYHLTIQVETYSDDVMSLCAQCQLLVQ